MGKKWTLNLKLFSALDNDKIINYSYTLLLFFLIVLIKIEIYNQIGAPIYINFTENFNLQ